MDPEDGLLKILIGIQMETKVSYTLAGTFILILLMFIVIGVIWLSAGLTYKKYVYYKVYMKESISGLSEEGPVEFNGVNVGTVAEMKISHENPQLVILLLKVERDTPVTMGTRAKLGMKALTGVAYLLLEDKGTDMRPIQTSSGERYPVIPTVPSILVRLDTTLTQVNESFQQLSKSVKSLLSKENLQWIQKLLKSGTGTFQSLESQTIPATNEAIMNIEAITRDFTSVSSEIKQNPSVIIRGKARPAKLGPGER
jgi:phospholipid/cholesterol/gamma-HCH transport system substrate-binding protein